jgi:hypothetical protein
MEVTPMKKEQFLEQYSEFQDLFTVVSEPSYSKKILKKLEEKYSSSGVNSYRVYWYYQIQGFKEFAEFIPEIDDWIYYYEQYVKYGGDLSELKQYEDVEQGQASNAEDKTSGSKEPLVFYSICLCITERYLGLQIISLISSPCSG